MMIVIDAKVTNIIFLILSPSPDQGVRFGYFRLFSFRTLPLVYFRFVWRALFHNSKSQRWKLHMTIYLLVLSVHPNHFVTGQQVREQWTAMENSVAIYEALHNYILKPFVSKGQNQLFSPWSTHFHQAQGQFYTRHLPIFKGFTISNSRFKVDSKPTMKPGLNLCAEFCYQRDTPCLLRHLIAIWSFVTFCLVYYRRITFYYHKNLKIRKDYLLSKIDICNPLLSLSTDTENALFSRKLFSFLSSAPVINSVTIPGSLVCSFLHILNNFF